jgi:DNA-binding SARP family transcriptional activator
MINYTVLGQVTACRGSWTAVLSPQQQQLLAVLVMARGAHVPRAGLVRALWDEEDPPEGGLKRVVSELRTQLREGLPDGDLLSAWGDTYLLPLTEQQADVLRFRSKIDQADRATGRDATRLMREALREWGEDATGLFGGQPLTGLRGRWADSTREKLRAEYRDARFHCLRQDFDDHLYDRVARECRQLANEPDALHDERFLELWMIATYCAGRRTEASQIYRRATDSAITHLGLELSGRLRKLAEIIRDEDHSKLVGPADLLDLASRTLSRTSTDQDSQEGPDGAGKGPHYKTHADEGDEPEAAQGRGNPHATDAQPAAKTEGGRPASHTTINATDNSTVFSSQVMTFGAFHFHDKPSAPGEENEAS